MEVKKIMLKSKKMKEYFQTHQNEHSLLVHKLNKLIKEFNRNKVKVSSNIPAYLEPSFVKEEQTNQKFGRLKYMRKKADRARKISKRTRRENPLITDPKSLRTFSSHKLWKIKHKKHRKRPDKKLIRKGVYKI